MKQFHWGHGLIIFFVCYISYLAFTVFASTKIKHSLVLEDYYALDIAYQDRYNAASNSLQDGDKPIISYDELKGQLSINFQKSDITKANVHLYRPSDATHDVHFDLETPDMEGNYIIDVSKILQGKWVAKLKWVSSENNFYLEEPLLITTP